jgi:hypothetical protein
MWVDQKFLKYLSVKSAEQKKMVESVEKVMAWRRVQEVKTHHVLDTERLEQQDHVAKVTPLFPSECAPQILRKLCCTRRRRAPSGREHGPRPGSPGPVLEAFPSGRRAP